MQCDETHPVCKNCQKSKRECLGYDPIFKQTQNPTNIQPAPNHAIPATASATILNSATTHSISGSVLATNPVPEGAAPYTSLPSVVSGAPSTPLTNNANLISPSQQARSSFIPRSGHSYPATLDPVLPSATSSTSIHSLLASYPTPSRAPPFGQHLAATHRLYHCVSPMRHN